MCPTMEAKRSPNDNMADGRTNEEVGEQRKANIRKRMALEKEEKEAKIEVRLRAVVRENVDLLEGSRGF